MAFFRRLLRSSLRTSDPGIRLESPTTATSPAVDPFTPDPNDPYYASKKDDDFRFRPHQTWSEWLKTTVSHLATPSSIVHAVLRVLDVVASDADGGGASVLPVVNEGFVKTPFPRKTGADGSTEDFMRIPVRKTVKDG